MYMYENMNVCKTYWNNTPLLSCVIHQEIYVETVNVHWLHLGLSPGYWLGNSWVSHLGKAHVHGWASALFCIPSSALPLGF